MTTTRLLAAAILAAASTAEAHGFGERYDLPVPLRLYVVGAGAAVLLSFVVMAVFLRRVAVAPGYPRLDLLRGPLGPVLASPALPGTVKAVGLAVFLLVIVTGLLGDQRPSRNLTPTMVWIIWWVGLAFVSALLGNLWTLLNPWRTAFDWLEALYRRGDPGESLALGLRYPPALGVWPALALLFAFAWVELISLSAQFPSSLAVMAIVYSAVTWAGMLAFGRERWLGVGEPFTLVFGTFARFSPTEIRVRDPEACRACPVECRDQDGECVDCAECFRRAASDRRELNLRPFGAGLLRQAEVGPSMMTFVLLILATVTYDGFAETPAWAELRVALYQALPELGGQRLVLIDTLGLVGFPLLFLAVYHLVAALMERAGAADALAGRFVFTLVPIAVAYHLAHYLSFLLIQGQLLIRLASDPFGWGWDLWGTARYPIDIGIVNAQFVWYWSLAAIVIGHVIAVFLAHHTSLRALPTPAAALRSQYPMMALMVGYTMVSLWIIAQPIVESSPGG